MLPTSIRPDPLSRWCRERNQPVIPDQVMWPIVLRRARSGAVTRKALISASATPGRVERRQRDESEEQDRRDKERSLSLSAVDRRSEDVGDEDVHAGGPRAGGE